MRAAIPVLTILLLAGPAFGAPTCETRDGDAVHCDSPGAMPFGWAVSSDQYRARQLSKAPLPSSEDVFITIGILVLFFALIALMPDFDGSRAGDWDRQEDDEFV